MPTQLRLGKAQILKTLELSLKGSIKLCCKELFKIDFDCIIANKVEKLDDSVIEKKVKNKLKSKICNDELKFEVTKSKVQNLEKIFETLKTKE